MCEKGEELEVEARRSEGKKKKKNPIMEGEWDGWSGIITPSTTLC